MSAPSTSVTDRDGLWPAGLECFGDGSIFVDQQAIAVLGGAPLHESWPMAGTGELDGVVVQSLPAGRHWHAEQVLMAGRCMALRLRPRPGLLRRWWSRWFGESSAHESALAARWRAPLFRRSSWGSATAGIDPTLRGAAVVTFRAPGAPEFLPVAGPAFWRRRTRREARTLVAEALARAGDWTADPQSLSLPGRDAVPSCFAADHTLESWVAALPAGFQWREGAGQWRARGTCGGWQFTLAFAERGGIPHLCWLLARLDILEAGAWEPGLERALDAAHRRWAAAHLPPEIRWRAVNDLLAKTGAELLVEWTAASADQPVAAP
ncbi:MAG: hypothetical protein ACKO0U_03250 [Gammaproteobacteria bacterium]